jgi:predicted oxidoreductase
VRWLCHRFRDGCRASTPGHFASFRRFQIESAQSPNILSLFLRRARSEPTQMAEIKLRRNGRVLQAAGR